MRERPFERAPQLRQVRLAFALRAGPVRKEPIDSVRVRAGQRVRGGRRFPSQRVRTTEGMARVQLDHHALCDELVQKLSGGQLGEQPAPVWSIAASAGRGQQVKVLRPQTGKNPPRRLLVQRIDRNHHGAGPCEQIRSRRGEQRRATAARDQPPGLFRRVIEYDQNPPFRAKPGEVTHILFRVALELHPELRAHLSRQRRQALARTAQPDQPLEIPLRLPGELERQSRLSRSRFAALHHSGAGRIRQRLSQNLHLRFPALKKRLARRLEFRLSRGRRQPKQPALDLAKRRQPVTGSVKKGIPPQKLREFARLDEDCPHLYAGLPRLIA